MVDPKTVDLRTEWLGLQLASPLVLGASPLTDDLDALEAAASAGAGAIVMRSLFEEQVVAEQMAIHHYIDSHVDYDAEARTFLPDTDVFPIGVDTYVALLTRIKARVRVPVLASLNGTTLGGWLDAARRVVDAGADGIELNLHDVVTDPALSSSEVEARQLAIVARIAASVGVPVSVKLSSFHASLPWFVAQLSAAGARGVVVFNRLYMSDIDVEALEVRPTLHLSTPHELPLRLHALANLSGRVAIDLAASGGVHSGQDVMKVILSGGRVAQMTSAVLAHGPATFARVTDELRAALARGGYDSADEARGVMDHTRSPDPHAWERRDYMRMLRGWQGPRSRWVR